MAAKVTKLKTATRSSSKTKPATAIAEVEPASAAPRPVLRMRDLVERVMDRSGMKKGEARSALEAATAAIADAVERGEDVDLPDLGKLKVQREKATPNGMVYTMKLVRKSPARPAKEGIAEPEKEG